MTSLNLASIQFFKRKITQPPVHSHQSTSSPVHSYQSTVISHQFTSLPVLDSQLTTKPLHYYTTIRLHQSTIHHSPLTTNSSLRLNRVLDTMALVYRHKPITRTDRNYSPFTSHHSLLISALGLIEFSIQWLWSIATNPSLELTGTIY